MTTTSSYIRMFLCVFNIYSESLAVTFYEDKYLTDVKYEDISPVGFQMCVRECQRRTYCNSANYIKDHFRCELKSSVVNDIHSLSVSSGSIVISLDSSNIISPLDHCLSLCTSNYSVCVKLATSEYACVELKIGCSVPLYSAKNAVSVPDPSFISIGDSYKYKCITGYIARGTSQTCTEAGVLSPSMSDVTCFKSFTFAGDSTIWALVFRVQSGVGVSDQTTWFSTGTAHETDTTVGSECESETKSSSCSDIYKTSVIADWNTLPISKAKLTIYTDSLGLEHHVTFNAAGSTSSSWWSPSNIQSSSWTDMTSSGSYSPFTISGTVGNRGFEMTNFYNGCGNDEGWFLSTDSSGVCGFDTHSSYPQFVYCTSTTSCRYDSESSLADVYMILIDADALL